MRYGVILGLLFLYAIEPVVWNLIAYKILTPKFQEKRYYVGFAVVQYGIIVLKQGLGFVGENESLMIVLMAVLLVYHIIGSNYVFKEKPVKIVLLIGMLYFLSSVTDMIAYCVGDFLNREMIQHVTEFGIDNLLVTAIARVIESIFCIIFVVIFMRNKVLKNITFYELRGIVLVIFAGIGLDIVSATAFILFNISIYSMVISFFTFTVQMTMVLVLTIYILYSEIKRKKVEEQLERNSLELKEYKMAQSAAEQLRQMRHDMANHMEIIMELANLGHVAEMQDYIKTLYQNIEDAKPVYLVQDPIISSILRKYVELTKQKNILFDYTVTISKIYMDAQDSVSLLNNILNNAIEACEKMEDTDKRYIYFDIQYKGDYYLIMSENSFAVQPQIGRRGKFRTSKEDKKNHGLGVSIIEKVVKKYEGIVTFNYDNDSFLVEIRMPYRGKKGVKEDANSGTDM